MTDLERLARFKELTPSIKDLLLKSTKTQSKGLPFEFVFYIQASTFIVNFILFTFIALIILNFIFNLLFDLTSIKFKVFKFLNLLFLNICLLLILVKFYLSIKLEQSYGLYIYNIKYIFYLNNITVFDEFFCIFSSSFSDSIVVLSFIVGIICLELLGYKNLFKHVNNISIFYIFNCFILIMVSTSNLLIMFLSFEFIFFPTIYYIYKMGYTRKVDKANEIIFYWTLCGSFIVLCILAYLFNKYNTLNYYILGKKKFKPLEVQVIFLLTLLGFGVKIPLVPFHFWLLKVHVESPTAFSIFLSGFLVKSALYCLFMLISIFRVTYQYFILTTWVFYGLIVATIGLGKPNDIKKLIAWATVQEMTFILVFLMYKQLFLSHVCILFVLLHGLISTYMFYVVDIIQRRYRTRALQFIKGTHITLPKLTRYIWVLLIFFGGMPITAKFLIEWGLIVLMTQTYYITLIYSILFVNFVGVVFFFRAFFTIIFGVPEDSDYEFIDTQKKEYYILNLLVFLMTILTILMYVL